MKSKSDSSGEYQQNQFLQFLLTLKILFNAVVKSAVLIDYFENGKFSCGLMLQFCCFFYQNIQVKFAHTYKMLDI